MITGMTVRKMSTDNVLSKIDPPVKPHSSILLCVNAVEASKEATVALLRHVIKNELGFSMTFLICEDQDERKKEISAPWEVQLARLKNARGLNAAKIETDRLAALEVARVANAEIEAWNNSSAVEARRILERGRAEELARKIETDRLAALARVANAEIEAARLLERGRAEELARKTETDRLAALEAARMLEREQAEELILARAWEERKAKLEADRILELRIKAAHEAAKMEAARGAEAMRVAYQARWAEEQLVLEEAARVAEESRANAHPPSPLYKSSTPFEATLFPDPLPVDDAQASPVKKKRKKYKGGIKFTLTSSQP